MAVVFETGPRSQVVCRQDHAPILHAPGLRGYETPTADKFRYLAYSTTVSSSTKSSGGCPQWGRTRVDSHWPREQLTRTAGPSLRGWNETTWSFGRLFDGKPLETTKLIKSSP